MPKSLGWYVPEQMTLKVTLAGSQPPIWRRVEVNSGLTLHELHYVIQCVFEWDDSHLSQFLAPTSGKLTRRALTEATRYHMMPPDPVVDDGAVDDRRADEHIIGRAFKPDQKMILYEYDFGDSWEHLVKLEKRLPGGDQSHVPQCLAGENAAPPEDCGGIPGYYTWLDALHGDDPDARDDAAEVLGHDFDPAHFDLSLANQRLADTFVPVPKRRRKRKGE
jgi:hypothetical protein